MVAAVAQRLQDCEAEGPHPKERLQQSAALESQIATQEKKPPLVESQIATPETKSLQRQNATPETKSLQSQNATPIDNLPFGDLLTKESLTVSPGVPPINPPGGTATTELWAGKAEDAGDRLECTPFTGQWVKVNPA